MEINFAEIGPVSSRELGSLIRAIPENWWQGPHNEMVTLHSQLRDGPIDLLAVRATRISTQIGREWIRTMGFSGSALINCTVSEERFVTYSIPTESGEFYQVRVRLAGARSYTVSLFYPAEAGSAAWFGRLAAHCTYTLGWEDRKLLVDGDEVTHRAWNAICSYAVARCSNAHSIITDMARDGEI